MVTLGSPILRNPHFCLVENGSDVGFFMVTVVVLEKMSMHDRGSRATLKPTPRNCELKKGKSCVKHGFLAFFKSGNQFPGADGDIRRQ